MLQQKHTKRVNYYIDFNMNTHSSLTLPVPPLSLKEENEISKKLGSESNFLKNLLGKPKGRRQRKCKSHREMGFFHFYFLTISYDDN